MEPSPPQPPDDDEIARLSQCFGKEAYSSWGLANQVAIRRNKRDRRLNVYRCPHCHQWHMGTLNRTKRPFRRGRRQRHWRYQ